MPGVRETLNLDPLLAPLRRMGLEPRFLGPLLQELRRIALADTRESFHTSTDPEGRPWVPVKKHKGRSLVRTGRLRAGTRAQVQSITVTLTNNVPYASFHQQGTQRIPRRQFTGFGQRMRPAVEQQLAQMADAAMAAFARRGLGVPR